METISDPKEFRDFNKLGNHWVIASRFTNESQRLTRNIVEFDYIEHIINKASTSVIAVYTPNIELLALYKSGDITDEFLDKFLNPIEITASIDFYSKFKQQIQGAVGPGKTSFIYAPAQKKWFKLSENGIIPTINKIGFIFALRIVNDKGEIVGHMTHPDLMQDDNHSRAIDTFSQLLLASLDAAIIAGIAGTAGDLF